MSTTIIETSRLILRELQLGDAPDMFQLDADPEVHRYLGMHPIKHVKESMSQIQFIQDQYLKYGIGRWAVCLKNTNKFIGWSGLKFITDTVNNHHNYYDIGYRFVRSAWGHGYATESALAVLTYGFHHLNLKEVFGIADIRNQSSIHVLEKVGLKKHNIFDYQGKPHYWMSVQRINENIKAL